MKIKVCGLKYSENILQIAELKPDYMGFIFYERSSRSVDSEVVDIQNISSSIKTTGVFVNRNINEIRNIVKRHNLKAIQLHGDETANYCIQLKQLLPEVELIKAFGVDAKFNFSMLHDFISTVDFFLFDTKSENYGGTGKQFDWNVLKDYPYNVPYFLSGGISMNELSAVSKLFDSRLVALDVNSKFEIEPGLKDARKVAAFINQFKNNDMNYTVNESGYYGDFGGAYIPEMLYPNVEELRENYLKIIDTPSFQEEFNQLLRDYVGRPSPLFFAERLSKRYQAKIFLKREDLNHTGAHKINNTVGQVLLAEKLGKKRIIAETGAGQHGVATATVCALRNLECVVYMGQVDIERQAPNVARMKMLGAKVIPAISGSQTLKDATNEAMRDWINNPTDTHYIIGSVVGPHPYPDMVAKFQSIISEETKKQLFEKLGRENPDYVLACVGGGSNAMGMFYHFLNEPNVNLIAIEAGGKGIHSGFSAATTQLGTEGVLHGSRSILMQTFDGQVIEPHSISAGLDYPGIGPQHAHLFKTQRAQYVSITDSESLDAGLLCAHLEGIIPAIESAHALAYLEKMTLKPENVVVVCLSGRGDKDMDTYINYFNL